jgi:hypothetical protein
VQSGAAGLSSPDIEREGEEDGLEAGEGFAEGAELEVQVAGLGGVVEPATKVVFAGAGVGVAEERGDLGGDFRVVEERESRGEGRRRG